MKKFMAAAVLIFAAMLLSFGAQAEAAKPKVMKVGLVTARDTAQAKALELFIKEVEQKSGGAIKGELFADAQLGGTREMIEALQSNIIQGYVGGAADLAPFVPSFNALELHLMVPHGSYKDYEAADKIFTSAPAMEMLKDLERSNMKGLAYWESGYKHITNNKGPITKQSQLKGLKVRSIENPGQVEALKILGALPVIVPFPEVFTSLQQGLIDSQENLIGNIIKSNFYQAQKYLTLSGNLYLRAPLIVNKGFFDSCTPEQQKILTEAAKNGIKNMRRLLIEEDTQGLAFLKSKGIVITEAMEPKEVVNMRNELRPMQVKYIEKYDPKNGKEFIKVIDAAWAEWEKKNVK